MIDVIGLGGMQMKPTTQKSIRQFHNQLGLFFAPGLLFFALSGIFQTLGLHESGPGRQPAASIIGILANVHKEGEAVLQKPRSSASEGLSENPAQRDQRPRNVGIAWFKIYALMLSVSLITSVLMGIAIALANSTAQRRTWMLLGAGSILPFLLLVLPS